MMDEVVLLSPPSSSFSFFSTLRGDDILLLLGHDDNDVKAVTVPSQMNTLPDVLLFLVVVGDVDVVVVGSSDVAR